ncbi:MAG: hypothetical protein LBH13_06075 [Cellulomonadaceae bacterium]|jgi:hypothetical protein|nr:hypothetical protein [Cellulomonadaceae bacterium]
MKKLRRAVLIGLTSLAMAGAGALVAMAVTGDIATVTSSPKSMTAGIIPGIGTKPGMCPTGNAGNTVVGSMFAVAWNDPFDSNYETDIHGTSIDHYSVTHAISSIADADGNAVAGDSVATSDWLDNNSGVTPNKTDQAVTWDTTSMTFTPADNTAQPAPPTTPSDGAVTYTLPNSATGVAWGFNTATVTTGGTDAIGNGDTISGYTNIRAVGSPSTDSGSGTNLTWVSGVFQVQWTFKYDPNAAAGSVTCFITTPITDLTIGRASGALQLSGTCGDANSTDACIYHDCGWAAGAMMPGETVAQAYILHNNGSQDFNLTATMKAETSGLTAKIYTYDGDKVTDGSSILINTTAVGGNPKWDDGAVYAYSYNLTTNTCDTGGTLQYSGSLGTSAVAAIGTPIPVKWTGDDTQTTKTMCVEIGLDSTATQGMSENDLEVDFTATPIISGS